MEVWPNKKKKKKIAWMYIHKEILEVSGSKIV
jgi:hypothetical protein